MQKFDIYSLLGMILLISSLASCSVETPSSQRVKVLSDADESTVADENGDEEEQREDEGMQDQDEGAIDEEQEQVSESENEEIQESPDMGEEAAEDDLIDGVEEEVEAPEEEPEAEPEPEPVVEEEPEEVVVQSNFQVFLNNQWHGVCCLVEGEAPTISEEFCTWREDGRVLDDLTNNLSFDCPENDNLPVDCFCDSFGDGERMHGAPGGPVSTSLSLVEGGAPIFPNIGRETCSYVDIMGLIKTRLSAVTGNRWDPVNMIWPDPECPHFRLIDFYP